jgi:hypothetical protein
LVLEVDRNAGAPEAANGPQSAGAAPSAAGAEASASTSPNRVPAFIALGVGGAGIIVGSVAGIMALGAKSTLDNSCKNKTCPASSQPDIDSLNTRATISTVGFIVGAVGVAVGAVLFATARGSESRTTALPNVRLQPWLGVGAAGVGGTFE